MDGLVKLSFYCFTAATIALAGSAVCYVLYSFGRIRVRRSAMATPEGATFTSTSTELLPGSRSFARYATMLLWFTVAFQGLAVATRFIAAGRGPISNMYEFSLGFVFAITLMYALFERSYQVKQMGAIVAPVALGMAWLGSCGWRRCRPCKR